MIGTMKPWPNNFIFKNYGSGRQTELSYTCTRFSLKKADFIASRTTIIHIHEWRYYWLPVSLFYHVPILIYLTKRLESLNMNVLKTDKISFTIPVADVHDRQ